MKNFACFLIASIFALGFSSIADDDPAKLSPAERAKWCAEFREKFETISAADMKTGLVMEACHEISGFDLVQYYQPLRPFYRYKTTFEMLELITDEDVKAVKKANAGTNTLEDVWLARFSDNTRFGLGSPANNHKLGYPWWTEDCRIALVPGFELRETDCLMRFWWYVGKNYASQIWEEWYDCWKKENARNQPREIILTELSADLSFVFYIMFPYIVETIKSGDLTIVSILNKYSQIRFVSDLTLSCRENPQEAVSNFWEEQKQAYTFDINARAGLEAAVKNARTASKVFETETGETEERFLKEWAKKMGAYYSRPYAYREKLYWYHFLDDEKDYSLDEFSKFKYELAKKAQNKNKKP